MAQEHNIKDIKVTYRSEGPNIKWEYLKKLHPAINVIRAVADHIEKEFGTYTRGKKHSVPKKAQDVQKLHDSYKASTYHTFTRSRKIKKKGDKAEDYTLKGMLKLHKGKVLKKWVKLRGFERSERESWDEWLDSDSEDVVE